MKKLSVFCIPLMVLVTCYIFVMSNMTGDLGNLGMIPSGEYAVGMTPDFVNYYECYSLEEAQDADIVVIGDSFSNKKDNGFVNYLGHELGKKVCHLYLENKKTNPCAAANALIDNDLLPNCKIMVVESCERQAIWRLNHCFDNSDIVFKERKGTSDKEFVISKYLNLNKFSSFLKLSLNVDNPVRKLKLDADYFTGKYADKLYFYASESDGGGDLWYFDCDKSNYAVAKVNLLKLKQKAEEKGIGFYFLMPSDKFDMYYEKIKDNPYPKNPTFEYFFDVDTMWYVAGKQILTPPLEDGVKDVYLVNDTHWSRIGAEIIGRHLARLIELQNGEER